MIEICICICTNSVMVREVVATTADHENCNNKAKVLKIEKR